MSNGKRQRQIDRFSRVITEDKLDEAEMMIQVLAEGLSRLAEKREEKGDVRIVKLLDKSMTHLVMAARILREAQKRIMDN